MSEIEATADGPGALAAKTKTQFALYAIRGWLYEWPRTLVFIVVAVSLAFFVVYPLGILFFRSVFDFDTQTWTLANYARFYSDPQLAGAFLTTLKLAFYTSSVCLFIALPMAWAVTRTNMPGRTLVRSLVVLTFATPSFLGAIGWIVLMGPNAGIINDLVKWIFGLNSNVFNIYTFEGMVFVLSLYVYPFLFFSVSSALDNMDPSMEQAARNLGASNLRVIFTVTLPVVTPAILSGLVLVILESFVVFGAPAVLGTPKFIYTLSTSVHLLFTSDPPQFDMAATAAMPILLVTAVLLLFQRLYLGKKNYVTVRGVAPQPELVDVGPWRYLLTFFCVGVVFVGVGLPWLALFQASIVKIWGLPLSFDNLTIMHYVDLFTENELVYRAFRNSFILAMCAALITVLYNFVIAWIVERTTIPGREGLAFLAMLPLSFPGVALGMALVLAFSSGPINLYGTLWVFVIAYAVKGTPFAFMFARSSLKQIHEELEQSSRALGASWFKTIRDITLPLVKKGLLSVGTILFAQKFRDAQTSVMLYVGGLEVVSILILDFVEEAEISTLGSMAFMVLTINLGLVLLSRKFVGKASFEL